MGEQATWRPPAGFRWWLDPVTGSREQWLTQWPERGGKPWQLTLASSGGRPAWYLSGEDPDGTMTAELPLGAQVIAAKRMAGRWITVPGDRPWVLGAAGAAAVPDAVDALP